MGTLSSRKYINDEKKKIFITGCTLKVFLFTIICLVRKKNSQFFYNRENNFLLARKIKKLKCAFDILAISIMKLYIDTFLKYSYLVNMFPNR